MTTTDPSRALTTATTSLAPSSREHSSGEELTATVPASTDLRSLMDDRRNRFASLPIGEVQPTRVWSECSGIAIEVGDDRYLADREIAPYPGRDWTEDDFPSEWNVVVFNAMGSDGPGWVILDAVVERLDASTLDVRHATTDAPIAKFVLDTTPPNQRITC